MVEPNQLEKKETLVVVAGGTLVYGFVSLQLYISGSILLPILIPVTTLWIYIFYYPNLK